MKIQNHVTAAMLWLLPVAFANYANAIVSKAKQNKSQVEFVPGEFVVQLRDASNAASLQFAVFADQSGLKVEEQINGELGLLRVSVNSKDRLMAKSQLMSARGEISVQQLALQTLQNMPEVKIAEPNFIYRIQGFKSFEASQPNDAGFGKLWGLHNEGQKDSKNQTGKADADIDAPEAWEIEKGSRDIVVAVIDTGIDYNHADLKENIWTKPGTTNVHGFNAITDKEDPMDDNNHGTHCAGTIGGVGNNGVGVAGVASNVPQMGVRFLSGSGSGTLANAIKAIDWATANGAHIMSNSWGGGGFSQTLMDAIVRAEQKGIIFIAAAGNDGSNNDSKPSYPASYKVSNVVSVAAGDNKDETASFTNYGATSVHLMAPGVNIYSTISGGGYDTYSGTSMATPHVSGAVALLLSKEPELKPDAVKERLMITSDKSKLFRKKFISAGRLNAYNLLQNIEPPGFVVIPESAWKTPITQKIETAHPYLVNQNQEWEIKHEGASFVRIHFKKFDTEGGYDFVKLYDKDGNLVDTLSGNLGTNIWTYEIPGDTVKITFSSDHTVTKYGFDIDSYSWTDFQSE